MDDALRSKLIKGLANIKLERERANSSVNGFQQRLSDLYLQLDQLVQGTEISIQAVEKNYQLFERTFQIFNRIYLSPSGASFSLTPLFQLAGHNVSTLEMKLSVSGTKVPQELTVIVYEPMQNTWYSAINHNQFYKTRIDEEKIKAAMVEALVAA